MVLRRRARLDLRGMDPTERSRVGDALERFATTGAGDLERIAGAWDPVEHRLRVGGWRVILALDEAAAVAVVLRLGRRGQVYRRGG